MTTDHPILTAERIGLYFLARFHSGQCANRQMLQIAKAGIVKCPRELSGRNREISLIRS